MTPQQRNEFERQLEAIVALMDAQNMVRLAAGYSYESTMADGRKVKRRIHIDGFEKQAGTR